VATGPDVPGRVQSDHVSVKPHGKDMASLDRKGEGYLIRFRYGGRAFKRSLKTAVQSEAKAALHQVQLTIHRLTVGLLHIPPGADPGDFIVSGGTVVPLAVEEIIPPSPRTTDVVEEYLSNLGHLAGTTRLTVRVQLGHLLKYLGDRATDALDLVRRRDLEGFLQARLASRVSTTVAKERATIVAFFEWAVGIGHLRENPAAGLTKVRSGSDLPPFRTRPEIEVIIARGGLTPKAERALWDCLYLTTHDISAILAMVKARARHTVSHILHAVPAYTGMRRGELLRLRWTDIEFDQNGIWARSLKQSRQSVETKRRIDLHSELRRILLDWREQRPQGQYVMCDVDDLGPMTRHQADERFWQPLKGTEWSIPDRGGRLKIGFHTYRHSFASNLAAAGVDQRVIDEFMGHTTEAMRKRYRHLFPRTRQSAIESFSLAPSHASVERNPS
jgi:integrase